MKRKIKYLALAALILLFSLSTVTVASASSDAISENEVQSEGNFFAKVYEEVSKYTGEILCALTFAGSITVAVAYKKGLLPLVEKTLSAIGGAVSKIKESTKESELASAALGKTVENKLSDTADALKLLSERITSINHTMNEIVKQDIGASTERRQLGIVVKAQIDMLYDVFMASSLPQYQKESVGEKIAKMKEALTEYAPEE